jgi:hypothetical protein
MEPNTIVVEVMPPMFRHDWFAIAARAAGVRHFWFEADTVRGLWNLMSFLIARRTAPIGGSSHARIASATRTCTLISHGLRKSLGEY